MAVVLLGVLMAVVPTTVARASTTVTIDGYDTGGSRCYADLQVTGAWCLWYSPDMDGGVLTHSYDIETLAEVFGNGGYGTAGVGDAVRNDAASMGDSSKSPRPANSKSRE